MGDHHVNVCQYGTRHGQCRCIDPNKAVRLIECPSPSSCMARMNVVQAPKHRKDVAPDSPPS